MILTIVGGAFYILENLRVKNIVIGMQAEEYENCTEFIKLAKKKDVKIISLSSGDILKLDKTTYFEVFFPIANNVIFNNKINNNSLVMKLVYKNFSMLFTGDIEKEAEELILKNYKDEIKSTALKVAHHGSKTSSNKEFLEVVKPKLALIGVGANNTFGHPSNITLESLDAIGCKIYRTDKNGEIIIKINRKGNIIVNNYIKFDLINIMWYNNIISRCGKHQICHCLATIILQGGMKHGKCCTA